MVSFDISITGKFSNEKEYSSYGLYLKTHSMDYVGNPEDFIQVGIGVRAWDHVR